MVSYAPSIFRPILSVRELVGNFSLAIFVYLDFLVHAQYHIHSWSKKEKKKLASFPGYDITGKTHELVGEFCRL